MEQYSRQFIEELSKHIDPAIIDFFNMKHDLFKFPASNIPELIDETLMDYLEGKTSREDLVPIISKQIVAEPVEKGYNKSAQVAFEDVDENSDLYLVYTDISLKNEKPILIKIDKVE